MKKLFCSLSVCIGLLASFVSLAFAECRSCDLDEISEITLEVVASDVDDGLFGIAAQTWRESVRDESISTHRTAVVESAEDLRAQLERLGNSCQRIKQLSIFGHGNSGRLSFVEGGMNTLQIEETLGGLDCVMASEARIDIMGCNVARACRGEDFLAEMADQLLSTGGGTIEAPTHYATTFAPGSVPHQSINFRNQALTVGPGMSSPEWKREPTSATECRERVVEERRKLVELREELREKECWFPSSKTEEDLENVLENLRLVRNWERGREIEEQPRLDFTDEGQMARQSFYLAIGQAEYFQDNLEDEAICPINPTLLNVEEFLQKGWNSRLNPMSGCRN